MERCLELEEILIILNEGVELADEAIIENAQGRLKWRFQKGSSQESANLLLQTIDSTVNISTWKHRKYTIKVLSSCFENIFEQDCNTLSDFYIGLSLKLGHRGYFNEAIEAVGKSLVIQLENNGVLNDKTAESHFILGSFFIRKELFDDAKRELVASRVIYQQIHGDESMFVSNCEFSLGHVEILLQNISAAFLQFYKCYYSRRKILGDVHTLTVAAQQQMQKYRYSNKEMYVCALELKHQINISNWMFFPQNSHQYVVSFFISRLADDVVMTYQQVFAIIISALKFFQQTFPFHDEIDVLKLGSEVISSLISTPVPTADGSPSETILQRTTFQVHVTSPATKTVIKTPETKSKKFVNKDPPSASSPSKAKVDRKQQQTLTVDVPMAEQKSATRPKTWKIIPPHSPLRTGVDYETQMKSLLSSINSNPLGAHFLHDNTGNLFFVKKCAANHLMDIIRPKLLAFGLFAWYAKNLLKSKPSTKLSVLNESKDSSSSAATGSNPDPKAALNALFMKRMPGPPTNPSQEAKSVQNSSNGAGIQFAQNLPVPPPLPTSWPPIPFSIEEITPASENSGDGKSDPSKPKLKLIHLAGLESVEKTFWAEQNDSLIPADEMFNDFEEEFTMGVKKKQPGLPVKAAAKPAASKPATEGVLDPQRSQNISIMLAKFGKKSLEEVAQAVDCFEIKSLGSAAVSALLQFVPSVEEAGKVGNFVSIKIKAKGDSQVATSDGKLLIELKIGKPEQYIYLFSKVRKLDKKLNAISTMLSASEIADSIVGSSETISNAAVEVKGSGKLRFVLKTVVELNNFLLKQAKSNASPITGTSISSWKKLAQVKLNSGETAQQYIVKKLVQHVPESLDFQNDIPSVDEAKGVLVPRLSADLKKLNECLLTIEELLADEQKVCDSIDNGNAMNNLQEHHVEMKKIFSRAEDSFKSATVEFEKLCVYFGETVPPTTPELFFGELSQFHKSIQTISAAVGGKQRRKAV